MEECCVHDCNFKTHDNVTFFKMPVSSTVARKWRKAVGRSSRLSDYSLVCSRHFREDEMTVFRGKVRLKAKVVPSVFSGRAEKKSTPVNTDESDIGGNDKKENNESDASDKKENNDSDAGGKKENKELDAGDKKEYNDSDAGDKKENDDSDAGAKKENNNSDAGDKTENNESDAGDKKENNVSDAGEKRENNDSVAGDKKENSKSDAGDKKENNVSDAGEKRENNDSVAGDKKENSKSDAGDKKEKTKPRSKKHTEPAPKKRRTLRKRKVNGAAVRRRKTNMTTDSDSDSDSDSEFKRNKKRRSKGAAVRRRMADSDSDSDSDSDFYRRKRRRRKEVSNKISKRKAILNVWERREPKLSSDSTSVDSSKGREKEGERVAESNGGEENGDNSNTEQTESINDENENSAECNILVTPSIEFFYNHDDAAVEPEPETVRPDIEDILTNYQIAQNNIHIGADPEDLLAGTMIKTTEKNKVAIPEKVTEADSKNGVSTNENGELTANGNAGLSTNERQAAVQSDISSNSVSNKVTRPEFIEVSVDGAAEPRVSGKEDCLLLLENVQVDVDPAELMLAAASDEDDRKEEPISLVTSSDESDVVIQEPKIDTVEVSSADEDDVPLTKLLDQQKCGLSFRDIAWGQHDYFCFHCGFTTKNSREYERHQELHTMSSDIVYLMCDSCEYTSSSSFQMKKHKRIHKDEKRYRCHLCLFRAKHKMSLTYHLREHEVNKVPTKRFVCNQCGLFQTNVERKFKRHKKSCKINVVPDPKKFKCDHCSYKTGRRNDMKRHVERRHKAESLSSDSD